MKLCVGYRNENVCDPTTVLNQIASLRRAFKLDINEINGQNNIRKLTWDDLYRDAENILTVEQFNKPNVPLLNKLFIDRGLRANDENYHNPDIPFIIITTKNDVITKVEYRNPKLLCCYEKSRG